MSNDTINSAIKPCSFVATLYWSSYGERWASKAMKTKTAKALQRPSTVKETDSPWACIKRQEGTAMAMPCRLAGWVVHPASALGSCSSVAVSRQRFTRNPSCRLSRRLGGAILQAPRPNRVAGDV